MNQPAIATARILDANANRAREAFRVVEDYARFAINDDALSQSIKSLRHSFTQATQIFVNDAILCRDTPGDVGTDNKVAAELHRQGMHDIVTAAGKRLSEALRTLEEYAKIEHPQSAERLEKIRYRWYELEQIIARTLRPAGRLGHVKLCVLITESACRLPWQEVARAAIAGGAQCLQLREKSLEGGELLRRARMFVDLCRGANVISIINDRPDVAILSGADGVHVGQGDLPADEVRKLIGNQMILGVSTHEPAHAQQAVRDGADYIGAGPIFHSPTKPRNFVAGLEYAHQVAASIPIPALAIAGITRENVAEVVSTGIAGIAVTSAITQSEHPQAATQQLVQLLNQTH